MTIQGMNFADIVEVTAAGASARLSPDPDDVSGLMGSVWSCRLMALAS